MVANSSSQLGEKFWLPTPLPLGQSITDRDLVIKARLLSGL